MGKGSNTTTNNSYSAPDAQAGGLYRSILDRASGVASTPYQAYSGQLTAGNNAQQNLGVGTANTAAGYANPYLLAASQQANASSGPITAGDIARYYDPYQQSVINATTQQLQHDFGQQHAQLTGNQIAQGALGGNATGVARGILAGQQARTLASTTAGLESAGYGQALAAAQRQQQTGLAGANAQAQYGLGGQNAGLQAAQIQYGLGTQQQATKQAELDRLYQQYAQAQAFPYQQTQWLAGVGTGVGSNLGGTSSSQTTAPPPNPWTQIAGLGIAAAGAFANRGGGILRAGGGGVMGYAGGGVPTSPWGNAGGWIPQMNIHAGSGAPQPHVPSAPNQQGGAGDLAKGLAGLGGGGDWKRDWGGAQDAYAAGDPMSGDAWGGGSFMAGDAYGGSSIAPLPGLDAGDYSLDYAQGGGVAGNPPSFEERWSGEPRSTGWDHFKAGAADFADNARTIFGGGRPHGPLDRSQMLWERDRRNGYAGGGGVAGFAGGGGPDFDERFLGIPDDENIRGIAHNYVQPSSLVGVNTVPDGGPEGVPAVAAAQMKTPVRPVEDPSNPYGDFRLHGSTFGPGEPPAVAQSDEGDEDTPENATPTRGVGRASLTPRPPDPYYATPDAVEPRRSFGLGLLSPNAKTGLLAAGLGMLASRSPHLGVGIGEGGLAGLSAYGQAENADRKAAMEAQKLAAEANKTAYDRWMGERKQGEVETHNRASEATARANLDRSKWSYAGQYVDESGVERPVAMDAASGKMVDGLTGKPLAGDAKVTPKGAKKDSGFTDEEAADIARRYVISGDRTQLQGKGPAARLKIERQIKNIQTDMKISDEELAQRIVEFEGRKAGSRTLGNMEAKMGAAAMEAEGAIKLVRGVIERLPRTGFMPFNKLIEGYSKNTLNPDQAELYARVQAIVNTYAAVMARGANITTDSSRHHASELLNTAGDPRTFNRVLDTMLNEIEMAKGSPARMQEYYRQHYGPKSVEQGHGSAGAPAGGAAQAGGLQEGRTGTMNGRKVIVRGGKVVYQDDGKEVQ